MQQFLLGLVTVLEIISVTSYVYSILKGETKPHRVTRFVLLVVLSLNFLSIVSAKGNVGSILLSGFLVVQSILVFILSLKRGMGGASVFDITCLIIALAGLVGWQLTNNPIVGIIFAILADQVAYLPAMVKTWNFPDSESPWFYVLGGLAAGISLASYSITPASAFQIYLVLNCLMMVGLIYRKSLGFGKMKARIN